MTFAYPLPQAVSAALSAAAAKAANPFVLCATGHWMNTIMALHHSVTIIGSWHVIVFSTIDIHQLDAVTHISKMHVVVYC